MGTTSNGQNADIATRTWEASTALIHRWQSLCLVSMTNSHHFGGSTSAKPSQEHVVHNTSQPARSGRALHLRKDRKKQLSAPELKVSELEIHPSAITHLPAYQWLSRWRKLTSLLSQLLCHYHKHETPKMTQQSS